MPDITFTPLLDQPAPAAAPSGGITFKPLEPSYTGTILPLRRDESGLHLAVPEAVQSLFRGMVKGGERALGVGEAGRDPLRPLDPETTGAVLSLSGTPLASAAPRGLLNSAIAGGDEAAIGRLYGRATRAPGFDASQVNEAVSAILEHGGGGRPGSVQEFAQAIERTKQSIADETATLSKPSYNRDPSGRFVPGQQARPSNPRLQVLKRQDEAVRSIESAVMDAAQRAPGGESLSEFLKTTGMGEVGAHMLGLPPGVVAGLKLSEQFYRWLRSPNRAVSRLFERAAGGPGRVERAAGALSERATRALPAAAVGAGSQDRDKLPDLSTLDPRLLGMLALRSR